MTRLVVLTLAAATILAASAIYARADGMRGAPPPPPVAGVYPQPVPQNGGSPGCLQAAQQLAYTTGRRELAYAATEACIYFTGARGVVLPYGFYGPYVPPGMVPPGWVFVPPPY